MAKKKKVDLHDHGIRVLTIREVFSRWLDGKLPKVKSSVLNPKRDTPPEAPVGQEINHLAIVLDGRVEEVLRAQNRMAALLLSEPIFVEFDPTVTEVRVGITEYRDGRYINPIDPNSLIELYLPEEDSKEE
jgi:hypothetical protein